ncbi:MAG: SusC/RagA family TonB-linked outer membrane protein [Saprospiraceae bacterium]|jgi:TonB-linked SusC/RagA family outer membrane protein|nr:SusC/RagA family TonB-linked outer membrane protein [Saprospiraceae bacterium]
MKFILPFILAFALVTQLSGQNINVSGKVVSSMDDEPLIGVNVIIKGTSIGTTTDLEGNYTLANAPANGTLEFSYVGFEKLEAAINGQLIINVSLDAGRTLDEVVVTSFGIAKEKKVLGYGSQKVTAEVLMQSSQPNVVNALQGKVAGVTINSAGGSPGAGANINIRGINSISGSNDNQPLFVVDGIIISNATNAGNVLPSVGTNAVNNNEQFMNTNRAADINNDDIESINILKGAAATALYGQRASNGAVIITTKKGKAGKTAINYSTSYGVQEVDKVPLLQEVYSHGINGLARTGSIPVFQQYGPPSLPGDPFYQHFRDFFRQGTTANHSLSFSGGSDKTSFLTSASFFNNEGITYNTSFQRVTAKLSATHQMSDKLSVGGQINYANSKGVNPASGDKSIYSSLSYWSPSFDVNDYLKADGTQKNITAGTIDNPRYMAESSPLNTDVNRVYGDMNLNYKFNSWLSARYQITADYYNDRRSRIVPPDLDLGTQVRGFITEETINSMELNSNFIVTANHKLNEDLGINVTVGNTITDIQGENLGARGEGFIAPGFYNILNTSNAFIRKSNSLRRIVGVFADARIDYKDYLYLNFTGRNDWSSTLPADNRSFFYPSASLSYIVSNTLLKDNAFFSFMKLRGSVAQVGKDASPYQIGTYFAPVPGFPFGTTGGFRRDLDIGNFNLLPELTTESEVGIEANFLNNLISLEANYFVRNSKNQIIDVPISNVTGFSRYTTNAGLIVNKGVEVLLGFSPLKGKFRWDIDINWTRIRNTVVSMPENLKEITFYDQGRSALRIVEGGSMGDMYAYDWRRNEKGEVLIGTNGLPTLDQSKYIKLGNALPDWFGGLNNTFSYKGLTLNVLLEVRQGGDMVDLMEMNALRNGTTLFTEDRNVMTVWNGVTADGKANTIPVIVDENTYRAFGINGHHSFNLQDASWFRIRNINLSYSLPKSLFGKAISSARLGISASNVFLSTPFRGYDPEALAFGSGSNLVGFTGRNTPNTRNINFNLNIGF